MRTGADYREALRDGRKLWVLGEGRVEDVTTHPATRAMVDEYVAWYDRHRDPEWQDVLFAPEGKHERAAWAYVLPKTSTDLIGMGRSFSKTIFLSAGNITHTPAYGHLIASGVLVAVQQQNASAEQIANAKAYRELIAGTGRFLTFCGGAAPIGFRLREDPADRAALKLVRETDKGVIISGRIGMHTSPAYAEDVYVGALNGIRIGEHNAALSCRSPPRGSRRSAASARRATRTRSFRRCRAAMTSSTARCG
jgi:4-hydroxyphenylacetate 3-monooxygenase